MNTPISSSTRREEYIQQVVQRYIHDSPNPDYTGLQESLRAAGFTNQEIFVISHRVREGDL